MKKTFKKRSLVTVVCALISALTISASGCDALSSLVGGGTSTENSSVAVESPETSESVGSVEEPESSEVPETSETPETSESPETSETPETSEKPDDPEKPQTSTLSITAPTGVVYPYVDEAKAYLEAGAGADVCKYAPASIRNPQKAIAISWKWSGRGQSKFLVEYATKSDYSDAISVEVGGSKRSVDVYNLYKGANYYLRIKALNSKGDVLATQEGTFQTTDLGPRVMNVDGISNVRDLGGWDTSFGKKIVQGIAYRGGALKDKNLKAEDGSIFQITEEGKRYMSEVMGIKGELDFRNPTESGITLEEGSMIPGATLTYITADGYENVITNAAPREGYRKVFSYLANKDNYPLYYHCTAGADRTGSVSYILHAFLGVSELECEQDYEFTSFSIYGTRGGSTGANTNRYAGMKRLLNEYPGDNLQQKAQNYLLDIGVTEAELNSILTIYFGEEMSINSSNPEIPDEDGSLKVTAPTGEVYPYVYQAKQYLLAGEGAEVYDYYTAMDNPFAPIEVAWTFDGRGASKFIVEYATRENFSDALSVEVGGAKRKAELYNLYKATNYYLRIKAVGSNGEVLYVGTGEFYTTDLGPRVMNIEGVHNVRDLGGYETSLGKTIVQGIAYRGGSLTDPPKDDHYSNNISEEGKKYMSEVMGIKAELDFRTPEESGVGYESVIPGATLTYITLGGYTAPFYHGKETYRQLFSYFADENNYPMYYHCTGGADRTGTVTFLLHAFLGVSELECIQGFAFTTFSIYGPRASSKGIYWQEFQDMISLLKAYEGDNLQQKTENYLRSIGVTETELYNIKAIFFGEPTLAETIIPASYNKGVDGDFVISMSGKTPAKLYLGGVETAFTYEDGKLIVAEAQLPSLSNGEVEGMIAYADGSEEAFTLMWNESSEVTMDGLFSFGDDGTFTLESPSTFLTTSGNIGYGKTAIAHLSSVGHVNTDGGGGLRIFLGSYGVEIRGNLFRTYTLDKSGAMKEVSRATGMKVNNHVFENGGTLYIKMEIVDATTMQMTIKVEAATTVEYTYNFTRIENEIESANAKLSFWFRNNEFASLTVYDSTAWEERK